MGRAIRAEPGGRRVVTRNSQESCSAGVCPAWDEHGQFLFVIKGESDEHR